MRAVTSLAGGIAHDFNNLLFAIMGNIEMAQHFSGTSQAARLDRAYQSCLEAKQLIRRFLEMAESDWIGKQTRPIADMIQQAVNTRLQESARIQYKIKLSGGLYSASYAYDQMLQVMANILSNAEQAIPGGGTITVSAENVAVQDELLTGPTPLRPGKYLKISIADTGIGIPADILDRIFDPYFTTRREPASRGHGLGLTTVMAVVKRHKGNISVESVPGKGTIVTLYLPAAL